MENETATVAVVGVEFGFQASRPSGSTATPTSFSYMGS